MYYDILHHMQKIHVNNGCFTCRLFAMVILTDVVFHSIFVIHASAYIFRNKKSNQIMVYSLDPFHFSVATFKARECFS